MGNPAGSVKFPPPDLKPFAVPAPPGPLDHELPAFHPPAKWRPGLDRAVRGLQSLSYLLRQRWSEMPERLESLRVQSQRLADHAMREALPLASRWESNARQFYRQARAETRRLAHERPVETIVGAAALAFVAGFGLRISRRSRHGRY